MKKLLCAALLGACIPPAFADVGVSINLGEPGFYGQIDVGSIPQPRLVYTRPVVIRQAPEFVGAAPIYLHVRPGYEKHWRNHCAQYGACGRPVFFVRDDWYNKEYVPRYRHDHERAQNHDHGRGEDRDHGRDHGHDHDHDRDHDGRR